MSFKGKSVIVTGSSSGIGLAAAIQFASEGANVTVSGRDGTRLQEAVKQVQQAGRKAGFKMNVSSVQGDINDLTVLQYIVEQTVKAFGRLDVLVANHAVSARSDDAGDTVDGWSQDVFDTNMHNNLSSVIQLIQLATPHLEKTQGNIVCVSSLGSKAPLNQGMDYTMSKAAMDHMVRCLGLQLGPKGIRINAINPTFVNTRLTRGVDPSLMGLLGVIFKAVETETPLQGQFSGPEEQAEVIVFLASDAARLVHGQCISVDGGLGLKGQPINFPGLLAQFMPQSA